MATKPMYQTIKSSEITTYSYGTAEATNDPTAEESSPETITDPEMDYQDEEISPASPRKINPNCGFVDTCVTGCPYTRKVVSHIFGRNKHSTRAVPDNIWILWCRVHYQRGIYRLGTAGKWHERQLRCVREQLDRFEQAGVVESWLIQLQKTAHEKLDLSDGSCWEGFLLKHLGEGKGFEDVRAALDEIEVEFGSERFLARRKAERVFPPVEFLPAVVGMEDEDSDEPSRKKKKKSKSKSKNKNKNKNKNKEVLKPRRGLGN